MATGAREGPFIFVPQERLPEVVVASAVKIQAKNAFSPSSDVLSSFYETQMSIKRDHNDKKHKVLCNIPDA